MSDKGLLGPLAINQSNLEGEGGMKQQHVFLGFIFGTSEMPIALPESKIVSAQVLIVGIRVWKGSHVTPIKCAQQLRGCMEHVCTTYPVWKILATPVDELLTYGDENNEWVSCPVSEIWRNFWRPMEVVETRMRIDSDWRSLFHGSLFRLLPLPQRFPLRMEGGGFIFGTAEAKLEWISGIARRGRECVRISTKKVAELCGFQPDFVFKIGGCEMIAAASSIFLWGLMGGKPRNVILRTDNRNVFHWVVGKEI